MRRFYPIIMKRRREASLASPSHPIRRHPPVQNINSRRFNKSPLNLTVVSVSFRVRPPDVARIANQFQSIAADCIDYYLTNRWPNLSFPGMFPRSRMWKLPAGAGTAPSFPDSFDPDLFRLSFLGFHSSLPHPSSSSSAHISHILNNIFFLQQYLVLSLNAPCLCFPLQI